MCFYVGFTNSIHAPPCKPKKTALRRNKTLPSEYMHSVKFQQAFLAFIQSMF